MWPAVGDVDGVSELREEVTGEEVSGHGSVG